MKSSQMIIKSLITDQSKPIQGEEKVRFSVHWMDCIMRKRSSMWHLSLSDWAHWQDRAPLIKHRPERDVCPDSGRSKRSLPLL